MNVTVMSRIDAQTLLGLVERNGLPAVVRMVGGLAGHRVEPLEAALKARSGLYRIARTIEAAEAATLEESTA